MAQGSTDLISMADIARLAGQSRATVGNWKARNPEDFPRERGRGGRGPLYDRAEVVAWLEATNRLDKRPPEVTTIWNLAGAFRGEMSTEDAMPLLLVLLAVMAKARSSDWQQLLHADGADLGHKFRATALSLFPFAIDLLPGGELPTRSIARAISTLSSLNRPRVAVMADALLEQAANAMGHRGGEFLSPQSVRKFIIAVAQLAGTVYNPATGAGQLMVDVAAEESHVERLVGQEINSRIWAMSQLNLAIHGVTAEVELGDVFGHDRFPELQAERVVAVPPWNQRLPIAERLADDPRWIWGEPSANDGNAAWTQHCLAHLADGGRAAIVLPNGALFEGGRAGRIRQRIVKAGLLDAVFALPPGLFAWTSVPCAVLVFVKGRANVDGKPSPTLMVDLTESSDAQSGRTATLADDLIDEVAAMYREWVSGRNPRVRYAAPASFDELAANEFIIDPGRYLPLQDTVPDIAKASRRRAELIDQLSALTKASRDADSHLHAILAARR
jgi:predicted DNA-binding transcriptional regulator AlpA